MAPRRLPNPYVLVSCSFFGDLLPDLRFLMFLAFRMLRNCQFLDQISMIFKSFLASWVVYAPRGQDTLVIAAGCPI